MCEKSKIELWLLERKTPPAVMLAIRSRMSKIIGEHGDSSPFITERHLEAVMGNQQLAEEFRRAYPSKHAQMDTHNMG